MQSEFVACKSAAVTQKMMMKSIFIIAKEMTDITQDDNVILLTRCLILLYVSVRKYWVFFDTAELFFPQ